MKPNMGTADRVIRILVAVVFSILFFTGAIEGTLAYILLALGGVFVLTSLVSTCPLYMPFKINTCKTKNKES